MFCQLWRDYKDYFKIPSYRDTLKIDFEKAKEYLSGWRPDHNLQIEISSVNEVQTRCLEKDFLIIENADIKPIEPKGKY